MAEHVQGQPGADRAVGRPGPAARMTGPDPVRPRPSVLIPPVTSASAAPCGGSLRSCSRGTRPSPCCAVGSPHRSHPAAPVAAAAAAGIAASDAAPATRAPAPAPTAAPAPQPQPRPQQTSVARVARSAVRPSSGPRAARVYLTHVDPWSVMKQAFLLSLALAVIILAASAALWFALDSAGIIDAITRTATDVGGESGASVTGFLDFGKIMGAALVVAGIETVLVTALCTLLAFMYNLSVGIGGGLEVTLSEED